MIEIIKEHPRAVMFAAIFHLVVVIVVGVSVDWTSISKPTGEKSPVKIVNAVAVDQKLVDKELKKIKDAEKKRIRKQKDAERKKKKAISDRKKEEKKLKELKSETKKEKSKQLALKKKRQADLKIKKEKQRKATAKRKKQAKLTKEKKRKEQFENELKSKLAKEEKERQAVIAAANNARRQSEIGKYLDRIKIKVQNNWITFRSKDPGKISTIRVKVIPGGEVIDAKTVKSSGDVIFDKDAVKAVWNASPLPIPPADSDIMTKFRDFDLIIGKPK